MLRLQTVFYNFFYGGYLILFFLFLLLATYIYWSIYKWKWKQNISQQQNSSHLHHHTLHNDGGNVTGYTWRNACYHIVWSCIVTVPDKNMVTIGTQFYSLLNQSPFSWPTPQDVRISCLQSSSIVSKMADMTWIPKTLHWWGGGVVGRRKSPCTSCQTTGQCILCLVTAKLSMFTSSNARERTQMRNFKTGAFSCCFF